jgi:hypothetical protein
MGGWIPEGGVWPSPFCSRQNMSVTSYPGYASDLDPGLEKVSTIPASLLHFKTPEGESKTPKFATLHSSTRINVILPLAGIASFLYG